MKVNVTIGSGVERSYDSISEAAWGISRELGEQVPAKSLIKLKDFHSSSFESSKGVGVSMSIIR